MNGKKVLGKQLLARACCNFFGAKSNRHLELKILKIIGKLLKVSFS